MQGMMEDGLERNASGMTKEDFVKDAPDKKLAEWLWEVTKDVKPLTEADLPHVWYNETGDILEVLVGLDDDGHYAQWINHTLTLLKLPGTDRVCGFQIWGVSRTSPRTMDWIFEFLAKNGVHVTSELEDKVREERAKL